MRNSRPDEAQAGIKISGRNINNLRYADGRKWRGTKEPLDESERGEWKSCLKAQHSENYHHGIWSHNFMANRWRNSGNSETFYFLDQISHSVMSDSLRPHESQHARPPCPSPTPRVHPDSCPSRQWCHPAISSSVVPFSSCPQPSQHQSLFQWVNSSHEVAKVLEFQL